MTEKEQLAIYDMKIKLCAQSHYKCEICGKVINAYNCQLAHIKPQTKQNIKKYGKEYIHSENNNKVVCSLECNYKAQEKTGCNNV